MEHTINPISWHWPKGTIILTIVTVAGLPLTACDSPTPSANQPFPPSSSQTSQPSQPSNESKPAPPSPLPTVPTTPIAPPIPEFSDETTSQKLIDQQTLGFGTFAPGEHPTQGTVTILDDEGTPIIQFGKDFQTSEGPDLFVILHVDQNVLTSTSPPAYSLKEGDYVAIAPLKAAQGPQNYTIPAAIILDNYQSISIWCHQFNATFGAASIQTSSPQ